MEKFYTVDFAELFIPSGSIVAIILRGTLTYFALLALLRIFPREPGKVGLADMLLVVILADASQNAMAGEYKSVTEGVVLVATLVFWNFFFDWLAFHWPPFRHVLEPAAMLLIQNGRMLKRNMRKEMITEEELRSQLRQHGVMNISDVREARMESDGNISVVKKE